MPAPNQATRPGHGRCKVSRTVGCPHSAAYEIVPSNSAAGPAVSHAAYSYLIDRQGRLRKLFRHGDSAEVMAEGLRLALREWA